MPLDNANVSAVRTDAAATRTAQLIVAGRENCIGVRLVNKNGATPAHIIFTRGEGNIANSVCAQVLASEPVNAYLTSTQVTGVTGSVVIGSSTGIYRAAGG